jgi:hypothetical protein
MEQRGVKCLLLKCSVFSYTLDHPTPEADDQQVGSGKQFANSLVVFVAVEPGDEQKINSAAKEIRRRTRQANPGCLVINPFMHLSDTPASPQIAAEVSRALTERLAETVPLPVSYTSFGWYKRFQLDVDGDVNSQRFVAI